MTFKIKLKVGFFKTRLYDLVIDQGQMYLKPQEENENILIIKNSELQSIYFIKKEANEGELEIVTHDSIYIGSLASSDDFVKLAQVLSKEFGNKFMLHKSALD